jgi:hypothetical protein
MSAIKILEELKMVDSVCEQLATEMQTIEDAYIRGDLSREERDHLLTEICDVRAARETAGNEIAMRKIVAASKILLAVM